MPKKKNAHKTLSPTRSRANDSRFSTAVTRAIRDLVRQHEDALVAAVLNVVKPYVGPAPARTKSSEPVLQLRRGGRPPSKLREEHLDALKGVIRKNPNIRAEQIDPLVSLPAPLVRQGLKILREQKWAQAKGKNRGMTYSERKPTRGAG